MIKKKIAKLIDDSKTLKEKKMEEKEDEIIEEQIREEEQSIPTKKIIEKIKVQEEKKKEKEQIQKNQQKIVSSLVIMAQGKLTEKMTKSDLNTLLFDQEFGNQVEKLRTEMQNEEDTKCFPEKSKKKISLGEVLEYLFKYLKEYLKRKKDQEEVNKKILKAQNINSKNMGNLLDNKKLLNLHKFSAFGERDYSSESSSSDYMPPIIQKPKTVLDNKLKLNFFNKELWSKRTFQENELLLHNELKYQIMLTNNIESKERFQNFFNQIEKLKQVDIQEYVRSLEENFDSYKEELSDLIEAREMEERINKFIFNFNIERDKIINTRKYVGHKIKVKDNKFDVFMGKTLVKKGN